MKGSARAPVPSPKSEAGRILLFEAKYPERLYRWEQRRFGIEAALGKARSKLGDRVVGRIGKIADRFHERIATPLLTGENSKDA